MSRADLNNWHARKHTLTHTVCGGWDVCPGEFFLRWSSIRSSRPEPSHTNPFRENSGYDKVCLLTSNTVTAFRYIPSNRAHRGNTHSAPLPHTYTHHTDTHTNKTHKILVQTLSLSMWKWWPCVCAHPFLCVRVTCRKWSSCCSSSMSMDVLLSTEHV